MSSGSICVLASAYSPTVPFTRLMLQAFPKSPRGIFLLFCKRAQIQQRTGNRDGNGVLAQHQELETRASDFYPRNEAQNHTHSGGGSI